MSAKTSAGRGTTSASGAKSALRSPSKARDGAPGGDTPARGRSLAAAGDVGALARRLAGIASLEDRLREIARSINGRVTFSTSLGLEDQAILHPIATSRGPIDVFTLDTGRHFPETLETLEASEQRYGVKIRVMAPDAREVEELVARDGIFGFRLAVENSKAGW